MNVEGSPQLVWFKSSHSGNEGGECVEVAVVTGGVCVRDSKEPSGPRLALTRSNWAAFVDFAARA